MKNYINYLDQLNRSKKILILVLSDLLFLFFSIIISFLITYKNFSFLQEFNNFYQIIIFNLLIAPILFWQFNLYRSITRYISINAMLKIFVCLSIYICIYTISLLYILTYNSILNFQFFWPNPIILWMVLFICIGGSRQLIRLTFNHFQQAQKNKKFNIIIYGTDKNALSFLSSNQNLSNFEIVGILSDDIKLKNSFVNNIQVLGDYENIHKVKKKYNNIIVLFISNEIEIIRKNFLINYFLENNIIIKSFLPINEFLDGKIIDNFFEISIEDLLGRNKVETDIKLVKNKLEHQTIFITGAGGSIGSELSLQITSMNPKNLIILDSSEFNLFKIEKEISKIIIKNKLDTKLVSLLGSVTNLSLLQNIMEKNNIDQVYHAAAYKHVPLVEHNIIQGVYNNVIGTYNLALTSYQNNVKNFIFISTDKAVRPTNIMGASKRLGELIIQGIANESSKFKKKNFFSIVRFGNVLGSSGSVVPTFKEQIKYGGPLTVTHKDVKRYFMTVEEAVELVIQTSLMPVNGQVYVLDMGEQIKIKDLAIKMIKLSGHQVFNENKKVNDENTIKIEYTGLRDGEKLYEELVIGKNITSTHHPKIKKAAEECYEWSYIKVIIKEVESIIKNFDDKKLKNKMKTYVKEYNPNL